MNDLLLVKRVIADLVTADLRPLVFGGWGEELLGLSAPRVHKDIDVVLLDPQMSVLDSFVAGRDEVLDGHLSHKRVYRQNGVKIELFIAQWNGECLETVFWDRLRWCWPADMHADTVGGLPVASAAAFASFRASFPEFMAARPGEP